MARTLQRRSLPRPRGFTLVEVLAVVVILGIASAIVIPQLGNRDDLIVASAARVLMSDLIYAQNRAITNQQPTYIRFYESSSGNRYDVLSDCTPDAVIEHPVNRTPYTVEFGTGPAARLRSIRIESAKFNGLSGTHENEFTLGFDELGTPLVFCYDLDSSDELGEGGTASSDHGVILRSGNQALRVTVERYTGEIGVQEVP
jgi:prepilin-type N-terminal cleavage/methylation domain-containing protein